MSAPQRNKRTITEIAVAGLGKYVEEVKAGVFPDDEHSYAMKDTKEYEKFVAMVEKRAQI